VSKNKRFRIRDIFIKYPLLDQLRIETIATFFDKGISMLDDSYRSTAVISPGAQAYVGAVNMGKHGPKISGIKPCIFAYYHGQMVTLMALSPRSKMVTLASNSRDGEMIARAASRMGFGIARGSKTHGGMKAGLELMTASENNQCILFNVDGPKGPRHVVKDYIIRVAEMSGLPIVPVVCDARTKLTINSWDKYICPFLNTKTVYIFGEPIEVGSNLSDSEKESARERLSDRLKELDERLPAFWTF
jgi:lysophospholipid acyltransferase (LPLAT)-like uncharacterized protein